MGNIYEDLLDGINECPSCRNSTKFNIITERVIVCNREKDIYQELETDDGDYKITCGKCGEVIREQD